jgi:superfamily II RNA helicase
MVFLCNSPYPQASQETHQSYFDRYPFPLSDFQKYAIEAIVKEQHVLVTAHTGSGKTLPAEFGISHFHEKGKKVIYTSPIKALSNQKYYEFSKKYPHITFGLFTGDIKTNPEADVLIMTTEILMNYLFVSTQHKKSEDTTVFSQPANEFTSGLPFQIDIQNELGCVVYDEVHYINDKERGQTWEKTILMLPDHIQMIMLSATIDNPQGFAKWCEKDGSKQVWLASTDHRVVPLTHYGFMTNNESVFKHIHDKTIQKEIKDNTNKLILLQEHKGDFQQSGYKKLYSIQEHYNQNRLRMNRKHTLNKLVKLLHDREMLPAIAFVFSRKQVESCAQDITVPLLNDEKDVPFNIRRECEQIIRKLPNYKEYLELPEYLMLVSLLEKGIGIHHSGMIPVLREIVEIMISKKYIYLLFATESFAIGLDCPIRTAVFTSMSKYDGHQNRYLHAHEYTQMAGRAGRRGIDTVGHVVHCNNLFPLPRDYDYQLILGGKPQKLVSKYNITFGLLLNLMKNGHTNDFHLFSSKSMVQNEINRDLESIQYEIDEYQKALEDKKSAVETLSTPYNTCCELISMNDDLEYANNKKRKSIERKIDDMKNNHLTILQDCQVVSSYQSLETKHNNALVEYDSIQTLIQTDTNKTLTILLDHEFVDFNEESLEWGMTRFGKFASQIAEVHPLVLTRMVIQNNYFTDLTTEQLVGFLSGFCDVKVPEEYRANVPNSIDYNVNMFMEQCKELFDEYMDMEHEYNISTGFNYGDALQYDIIDLVMEWCSCGDEEQCKYFLQKTLPEHQISVGDFNKALLKIVTITRELMIICEDQTELECLQKLKNIEPLILKYVATSQSLYV